MVRFLIFVGYFQWMMSLLVTGKLSNYINTHYRYLVIISMVLSLVLALVQLKKWVDDGKKDQEDWSVMTCFCQQPHLTKKYQRVIACVLLALPVAAGFLMPVATLDASTVAAKGLHFPVSSELSSSPDIAIQYLRPDTSIYFSADKYQEYMEKDLKDYIDKKKITITETNYLTLMELIYRYPHEFEGKELTFTGFVFHDTANTQIDEVFVLRFGVIHCIADSGVFGLLTKLPDEKDMPENTWVSVTGEITLTPYAPLNAEIPEVVATSIKKIDSPENQYVYRNFSEVE